MNRVFKAIATLGTTISASTLCFSSQATAAPGQPGDLIVNEFNAVGPEKYLEECDDEMEDACDITLGRVEGNGGDWLELVVVEDGLDIRGWTITWGNDDPSNGTLTFTQDSLWNGLEAGTIITIRDDSGFSTDDSYDDPCTDDDWLIEIDAFDTTYVTQSGDDFKTDNDGWIVQIDDDSTSTPDPIQEFVGETSNTSSVIWAGSGVNSREVGKLEADPSRDAADPSEAYSGGAADYNDGNCSSYGAPNCWDDGTSFQDFSGLRTCS